jgi:hypothetical protein
MALRTEKVTTKLAAPNIKGFLRPTESRTSVIKLHTGLGISGRETERVYSQEVGYWADGTIYTLHEERFASVQTETLVYPWTKVINY